MIDRFWVLPEGGLSVLPGSTFGAYQIVDPLGKGGMASVYKAYESALDRYVALKVLPGQFVHDETFAERFKREAKVIARLEHPNIVPIHAFGIENGVPWMAMRLVTGGALSGILRSTRLEPGRVVAMLRGAAEALDYARSKGVVHRDVKPQNILLDEAERVYLADFGIAKMLEGSQTGLTATGMINGTPQYMAPEQATGQAVDHRADIYALGVVAYEMLTGRVPFAGDTPVAVLMKHVSEPVPSPSAGEVPEPLVRALMKALAKRPEDRYPSAVDFVKALEQALAEMPTVRGPSVPTAYAVAAVPSTVHAASAAPTLGPAHASAVEGPRGSGGGMGLIIGLVVGSGLFVLAAVVLVVVVVTRPSAATAGRATVTPPPPTTIAGIPLPSGASDRDPAPAYPRQEPPPSRERRRRSRRRRSSPSPPLPEDSHLFAQDTSLPIEVQSGPVRVPTVRFTTVDKGPGKVDLRATFPVVECSTGDWEVYFTIDLLDDQGRLLNTYQHHTGCENERKSASFNKGMLKALVGATRSVRVRLRTERD